MLNLWAILEQRRKHRSACVNFETGRKFCIIMHAFMRAERTLINVTSHFLTQNDLYFLFSYEYFKVASLELFLGFTCSHRINAKNQAPAKCRKKDEMESNYFNWI